MPVPTVSATCVSRTHRRLSNLPFFVSLPPILFDNQLHRNPPASPKPAGPRFLHRVSFANGGLEMKAMIAVALCVLLVVGTVPASADFKYTDTSKITGRTLKSMMQAVTIFTKQASEAMKPVTTTRYTKANHLLTHNSD